MQLHRKFFSGIGLLCIFFLAGIKISAAENSDFNTRLWQVEDGLPHNIVQAVTQTSDGYLWVGTREGLARFDGERFQTLPLVTGNVQPSVLHLLGAKDGSLWAGTEKWGLFHYRDGKMDRCELPDGRTNFEVYDIREAADGSIWFGTTQEIYRWQNGKAERRTRFRFAQQFFSMDGSGQVWFYDTQLKRLDTRTMTNYPLKSGSWPHEARSLYADRDGVFWIGAFDGGLMELKDGSLQKIEKADGPAGFISVIFRDSAANLWIGSYAGLARFADGKFIGLRASDDPSYRIYAIYEDREQNLWVGSEEGLARLTPKRFTTITKKDGLTMNKVVTVCPGRDGGVWIGSWGGGLNHWLDGQITSLGKTNGLSSDFIMALAEARDGSLWVGVDYGAALNQIRDGQVTRYGPAQGFTTTSGSATTAILEDQAGTMWFGARESLQC